VGEVDPARGDLSDHLPDARTIGEIVACPEGATFSESLLDEVVAIVREVGEPPSEAFLKSAREQLTAQGSPLASSMYRDLIRGRPIEAEAIVGSVPECPASTDANRWMKCRGLVSPPIGVRISIGYGPLAASKPASRSIAEPCRRRLQVRTRILDCVRLSPPMAQASLAPLNSSKWRFAAVRSAVSN
jgi:hypothetical protein